MKVTTVSVNHERKFPVGEWGASVTLGGTVWASLDEGEDYQVAMAEMMRAAKALVRAEFLALPDALRQHYVVTVKRQAKLNGQEVTVEELCAAEEAAVLDRTNQMAAIKDQREGAGK